MRRNRQLPFMSVALGLPAVLCVALASILAAAPTVHAQDEEVRELRGVVRDASDGRPLNTVLVEVLGAEVRVVSDSAGSFRLRVPEDLAGAGPVTLRASLLGYATLHRSVRPDDRAVELRLEPEPVVLEGIEIVANRFDRRLDALPVSVRVLDRESIVTANAIHAVDVLQQRLGMRSVPCTRQESTEFAQCYSLRGQRRFTVFIDEFETPFGLDELTSLRPGDIWRIELIGRRQIRVYTNRFMDRSARTRPYFPVLRW